MRKLASLVAIAALVAFAPGCKKKPVPAPAEEQAAQAQAPQQAGTPGQGSAAMAAPRAGDQVDPNARVPSSCPEGKKIEAGDMSTPGGTVYLAYQAALKGDTPEAFEAFASLFQPDTNIEELRRTVWAHVLQYVTKYTSGPDNPSFVQCRTVSTGDNRLKIFVKCNDPKKSDPPIVLQNMGGKWMIDVMTP